MAEKGFQKSVRGGQEIDLHRVGTTKTFVTDMVTYLPSKLLPALTGLITVPILTHLFSPSAFGDYVLALGVSDFMFALSCSGFGSAALRFFPEYKAKSELRGFFASLSLSMGMVMACVVAISLTALFVLKPYVAPTLYPLFLISIFIYVAQSIFVIASDLTRAQERSRLYTFFQLVTRYGGLGLGLSLVIFFDLHVEGLLWGTLISLALALPFLLVMTGRGLHMERNDVSPQVAMQMWRYARSLNLGNMAMWGLRLSDRYMLSVFRPASEVGLYSAAYSLSEKSIDIFVAMFLLSMGPLVMNTWERHGREATERDLTMITRLFLILCLPACIGLTLLASPFVRLLTADAYHEGYRIVGYVAFSSFFWGLSQIAGRGMLISKQTTRFAVNQIVAALINLGLNLALIPTFGFVAAGITTLIGYVILFVLQIYGSRHYLTWRFPFKTLINVVGATVCMGLAVGGLQAMSDNGSNIRLGLLLQLFVIITVGILTYIGVLWLLGEANEKERAVARRLWKQALTRVHLISS